MSEAHRKPRLPDGICIYAVSDIHGCADQLAKVFAAIDYHLSRVQPRRLIERGRHYETIFLKGNHEAILVDLLRDPDIFPIFQQYGGLQTLLSYGLVPSVNPSVKSNRP